MPSHHYLFDFDGTIVENLDIDYIEMKRKIQDILGYTEELSPMVDIINNLCENDDTKRELCFSIIDNYEMAASNNCKINSDILQLYNIANPKIIISRNGEKVIRHFLGKIT
jgi:hypothetical protein